MLLPPLWTGHNGATGILFSGGEKQQLGVDHAEPASPPSPEVPAQARPEEGTRQVLAAPHHTLGQEPALRMLSHPLCQRHEERGTLCPGPRELHTF